MVIYKTTNIINNKIYIGKDAKNRPCYLGSGVILQKAIKKYGKDNFRKEIICKCSSLKELNKKEIFYINKLNPEYNLTKGGTGGDTFTMANKKIQDKRRLVSKKVGLNNKGKIRSNEFKKERGKKYKGKGNPCYGRKLTEKERNNISKNTKKVMNKIKNKMKRIYQSKEYRNRISKSKTKNIDTSFILLKIKLGYNPTEIANTLKITKSTMYRKLMKQYNESFIYFQNLFNKRKKESIK